MKRIVSAIAITLVASALPAVAQMQMQGHEHGHAMTASAATADYTQGEVKKIDKAAGKITIKHGPIVNLGMPGMTMVFRAKNPASLDHVNVGDNVLFKAESVDGALTVTELRKAS